MPSYDVDGCNCYISGPVTGKTKGELYASFGRAELWLSRCGAKNTFSPPNAIPPHYTHEEAMLRCIEELVMTDWEKPSHKPFYDYLVQLDGWEWSRGAEVEKAVAKACGIEVISIHDAE